FGKLIQLMKNPFLLLGVMVVLTVLSLPVEAATVTAKTTTKPASVSAKQQLIINVLPDFIKVFGNDPTNSEKTWWRARISCGEIKTEAKLLSSMQYTKAHKARMGSPTICGRVIPNNGGVITRTIAGIGNSKMGDQIRVGS